MAGPRDFHYDGSGQLVPIGGRAGLALTLRPATAHDRDGNVYEGPRVARPHLETPKALAMTGDFEGTVSFGFALTTGLRTASSSCTGRSAWSSTSSTPSASPPQASDLLDGGPPA